MDFKMVKRLLPVLAASVLSGCAVVDDPAASGRAEIVAPYVGQGTGVLVHASNRTIAFDAGPDSSAAISRALRESSHAVIDLLVISHWDLDHVGGLDTLVARNQVRKLLYGRVATEGWMREKERSWCARIPEGCRSVLPGESIGIDENFRLEFSGADSSEAASNEQGLVARLVHVGGRGVLLAPGDIDSAKETDLLSRGTSLQADILLVGHHGSRGSSSLAFLNKVAPHVGIIQASPGNRYGHPHIEALERLRLLVADLRWILPENAERLEWDGQATLDPGVP